MMYDFKQHLEEGEEIIYEGRPHSGKGSKNVGGSLFLMGFSAFAITLLILSLVFKIGDGAEGFSLTFLIFFIALGFFFVLGAYNLIYNFFIKKNAVKDDYFCITNKRALKYESKKDELVYGYLDNYTIIRCENEKDGYGDLTMCIDAEKMGVNPETASGVIDLKNMLLHPNKENMPQITFESIEHPRSIKKLIKEQQKTNAAQ